jgi:hypothetical protein
MSGLTGDLSSLSRFSAALRRLPTVVAQRVAEQAAPALTDAALSTFNASQDPFGTPWDAGADGQRVTLRRTGALAKYIRYVAIGTKLRVSLGVSYAKYKVAKRPIFPKQGEPLPVAYVDVLRRVAADVCREELSP